jgi:hypothetical protein
MKIEVGMTVYLKPIGNAARRGTAIIETTVTKVGRKYFEVEQSWTGRFFIETMYQDGRGYISDYHAYLSVKEIEDDARVVALERHFRALFDFSGSGLSLEKLEKMKIIAEGENR